MTVEIMYAITAFVCMALVCIILNRMLATKYKETIDRQFVQLEIFFVCFTAIDGIWGTLFSRELINAPGVLLLFSYFFHIMSGISAVMWSQYVLEYVKAKGKSRRLFNIVRFFLLAVQVFILIYNIWSRKAFLVTRPEGLYRSFPLRKVLFYCQFTTYFSMFIYTYVQLQSAVSVRR